MIHFTSRHTAIVLTAVAMLAASTARSTPVDPTVHKVPPTGSQLLLSLAADSWGYALLYRIPGTSLQMAMVPPSGAATTTLTKVASDDDCYTADVTTSQGKVFVAWDGRTGYLDPTFNDKESEVRAAILGQSGTLLINKIDVSVNPDPSKPAGERSAVRVATDGTQFAVLYHHCDELTCSGLKLARFDGQGNSLQAVHSPVGGGANLWSSHDIAFDDSHFVIVRTVGYHSGVEALRYSVTGGQVGVVATVAPTTAYVNSVRVCGGPAGQALAVWSEGKYGMLQIKAARLSAGAVLDGTPLALSVVSSNERNVDCSWDGSSYWVTWSSAAGTQHVAMAKVSSTGAASAPIKAVEGFTVSGIAVHHGGGGLLAWNRGAYYTPLGSQQPIYGEGLPVGPAAAMAGHPLVVGPANTQTQPAVAGAGPYLAVWNDNRDGDFRLRARLVSAQGTPLGPATTQLGSGPDQHWSPSVAFDGSQYLVLWRKGDNKSTAVRAALVSSTLQVGTPFTVAASASGTADTAALHDGTHFVALWSDGQDVRGIRISGAGALVDPAPVSLGKADKGELAAGLVGGTVMAGWLDASGGSVQAVRLAGGKVLDAAPVDVCTGSWYKRRPSVVAVGGDFLLAWSDRRQTVFAEAVYGARVSTAGTVLDPNGLALAAAGPQYTILSDPPLVVAFGGAHRLLISRSDGMFRGDLTGGLSPVGGLVQVAGASLQIAAAGDVWLREAFEPAPLSARRLHLHTVSGAAAPPDAGPPPPDGGPDSAQLPDSTTAPPDGGPSADSMADAGPGDSVVKDGPGDGHGADAGGTADSATTGDGTVAAGDGCSCRAGAGQSGPTGWTMLLLALFAWCRRKPRNTKHAVPPVVECSIGQS